MNIKVNFSGMDKVEEAMERARACMNELEQAINGVYAAMQVVGAEITQPPEETDG